MIWRTPIIDGNQRYSWTKNRRSLLVSRALPRHVRPSTISCWRRTAFSASSRAVDLNGETKRAKANHRSPITRSAYAIRPPPQWNEVFGTHNLSQLRLLLFAQSGGSIAFPLVILVFWLAIIFARFNLFGPTNLTVLAFTYLFALSAAGAILLANLLRVSDIIAKRLSARFNLVQQPQQKALKRAQCLGKADL